MDLLEGTTVSQVTCGTNHTALIVNRNEVTDGLPGWEPAPVESSAASSSSSGKGKVCPNVSSQPVS